MDKFKQMAKDFGSSNLVLRAKRMVDSSTEICYRSACDSIEIGYRSACDYPLVLGAGILLLLLHRICPPLLAFLVSSSPLLLLTGLLLGALLSYGEPCTPSVTGEEACDNQQTLAVKKTAIADCSDEEAENVTIETRSEKRTGSAGFSVAERNLTSNTHDTHWEETNVTFLAANIAPSTEYAQTSVIAGREMYVEKISEKADMQGFQRSITETGDYDEAQNHYQLGESMSQCWKSADRQDPCYDSESDLTDVSSSPDASMTDIIPMLEELHPLIDLGTGHSTLASRDNLNSSSDDDEDDLEEDDDDTSDDEDEGEEEEKDDGNNQEDVTENNSGVGGLMGPRRAKNILKFELDQRLMDLQTTDATEKLKEASRFYVQVPSISTPRGKPFDLSNVSEEVIELPQVPDSAPSVLLPSQNLFDDHDSQLQETWTPRLYSPAAQLKHGNLHGRRSANPHHNGLKMEKGDVSGEDAVRGPSVIDAAELGKDDKLSQVAHVGEDTKILSAANSVVDVFKVDRDNGRHEDNKNADFSDDVNSFPIMENGSGTSEPKESVHAGSENSTLCSLSEANYSEQHAVKANSIDEVNSLFRCHMEEVLVQSISETIIGQPLTVKLGDELSDSLLSSDSGVHAIEASSIEELNSQLPQINKEALTCNTRDSTCDDELIQEKSGEAFPAAALETEIAEDVGCVLEQLNSGHDKVKMSQDGEAEPKPFELSSGPQVKEAHTLDEDSNCDTSDSGLKVTELKDSAEKPTSIVVEGRHEDDA